MILSYDQYQCYLRSVTEPGRFVRNWNTALYCKLCINWIYRLYFFSFHELEDVSSLQTDILFQNIKGKFHFFSVKDATLGLCDTWFYKVSCPCWCKLSCTTVSEVNLEPFKMFLSVLRFFFRMCWVFLPQLN